MKLKDMEAPAKLTTIRLALIPLFMLFTVYDFGMDSLGKYTWPRIIAASFFILACIIVLLDKRLLVLSIFLHALEVYRIEVLRNYSVVRADDKFWSISFALVAGSDCIVAAL